MMIIIWTLRIYELKQSEFQSDSTYEYFDNCTNGLSLLELHQCHGYVNYVLYKK